MRLSFGRWLNFFAGIGRVLRNRRQRKAQEEYRRRRRALDRLHRFDALEQRVVMNADPVAVDDEFYVTQGDYAPFTAGDLLANDTDGDSDPLAVTSFDAVSAQGGRITRDGNNFTYRHPGGYTGDDTFNYVVDDGQGGSDTGTVTMHIASDSGNHAPVLTPYTNDEPTFADIDEDASSNSGTAVADLIDVVAFDPIMWDADGDTLGMAIIGVDNSHGAWEYSTDGGANWSAVGSRSADAALLLSTNSDNKIRFVPAADYHGGSHISIRLWDGTDSESSGSTVDTTTNGGATAYSTDYIDPQIAVNPVNDAPTVETSQSPTINEDAPTQFGGSDVDGDELTASIVTHPSHGTLSVEGAVVLYTPDENWSGEDEFEYKVGDGAAESATATVNVTVRPVNDAPSFTPGDDVGADEDGGQYSASWATNIATGPSDESGQTPEFIVTNNNPGLFSEQPAIDASGNLTFTPAANAHGAATVTVKLRDDGGTAYGGDDESAPVQFTVTVNPTDDAVVPHDDEWEVDEEALLERTQWQDGVLGNDENIDGANLEVELVTGPEHAASFTLHTDGRFSYLGETNFVGVDTFTYRVWRGATNCGTALVTITVNPVQDPPTAVNDELEVDEDGGLPITPAMLLANDGDVDGDEISFGQILQGPAHGTLTATETGWLYEPMPDYFGPDEFSYEITDGTDTDQATVHLSATPVNAAPSFTAGDNVQVNEDSGPYSSAWATNVSAGAPEEDDQTLTFVVTNDNQELFEEQPAIDASGNLTFKPAANAHGTATVTVRLEDDGGTANGGADTSSEVEFTITINSVNDSPWANNDSYTVWVNHNQTTPVAINGPSPELYGDADDDDLEIFYVPVSVDPGSSDSLSYTVTDPSNASAQGHMQLSVNILDNRNPELNSPEYGVDPSEAASFNFTPSFRDEDGDSPSWLIHTNVDNGGEITLDANQLTFHANGNTGTFSGAVGVSDGWNGGAVANVTFYVSRLIDDAETNEDSSIGGLVLNRTLIGATEIGFVRVVGATHGTLKLGNAVIAVSEFVSVENLLSSGFTFIPEPNFVGNATFSIRGATAANSNSLIGEAVEVTIVVHPVNDAPSMTENAATVGLAAIDEDSASQDNPGTLVRDLVDPDTYPGFAGDVDGDVLGIALVAADLGHGAWEFRIGEGAWETVPGDLSDEDALLLRGDAETRIRFVPAANYRHRDGVADPSITFRLWDRSDETSESDLNGMRADVSTNGGVSPYSNASANAEIAVNSIIDSVTPNADSYSLNEDTLLELPTDSGIEANDDNVGDEDTIVELVEFQGPRHGILRLESNGAVAYLPDPDWNGIDSFSYRIVSAGQVMGTAQVTITVNPVNDAPRIVAPVELSTVVNGSISFGALTNHPIVLSDDSTSELDVSLSVEHGGLTLTSQTELTVVQGGTGEATLILHGTAANINLALEGLRYDPETGLDGSDELTIEVEDLAGASSSHSTMITVLPRVIVEGIVVDEEDGTAVVAISLETETSRTVTMDWRLLSGTAVHNADFSDAVTTDSNEPASSGTLTFAPGQTTKTITITLLDDSMREATESLSILIDNVSEAVAEERSIIVHIQDADINTAPAAAADSYIALEDEFLVREDVDGVLANDGDDDGDILTVELLQGPAHGSVTISPRGGFVYFPDVNFAGNDSFAYRVRDVMGAVDEATVSITVNPIEDAPSAVKDVCFVERNGVLNVSASGVLANDSDPDGLSVVLRAAIVSLPQHGTLELSESGAFVYRPAANFSGSDSFRYQATDGEKIAQAIVHIDVGGLLLETSINLVVDESDPDLDPETINYLPSAGGLYLTRDTIGGESFTHLRIVSMSGGEFLDHGGTPIAAGAVLPLSCFQPQANEPWGIRFLPTDNSGEDGLICLQAIFRRADDSEYLVGSQANIVVGILNAPVFTDVDDVPVTQGISTPSDDDDENDPIVKITANPGYVNGEGDNLIAGFRIGEIAHGALFIAGESEVELFSDDDVTVAEVAGGLVFRPASGFVGLAYITVRGWELDESEQPQLVGDSARLDIAVTGTALAGVTAVPDSFTTEEDGLLEGDVTLNDGIAAVANFSVALVVDAKHGHVVMNADGTFTYTPDPDYSSPTPDNFTYALTDADDNVSLAVATIGVTSVNDAPSFTKGVDLIVANDLGEIIFPKWAVNLSAGPLDEADQELTFEIDVDEPLLFAEGGLPTISPDGTLGFTPSAAYYGVATATVTLHDDVDGVSVPQTFTIETLPPATGGDGGGSGVISAGQSVPFYGAEIIAPKRQYLERNTTRAFSGNAAIVIGGNLPPGTLLKVKLSVKHGELTPSDREQNDTLTIVGTAATVAQKLARLKYRPTEDYVGRDMLSIEVVAGSSVPGITILAMLASVELEIRPERKKDPTEYRFVGGDVVYDEEWAGEGAKGKIVGAIEHFEHNAYDANYDEFAGLSLDVTYDDQTYAVVIRNDGSFEHELVELEDDDPSGTNGDRMPFTLTLKGEIRRDNDDVASEPETFPEFKGTITLVNLPPVATNAGALLGQLQTAYYSHEFGGEVKLHKEVDIAWVYGEMNARLELLPVFYQADAPDAEDFVLEFTDPGEHDEVSSVVTHAGSEDPDYFHSVGTKLVCVTLIDDDNASTPYFFVYEVISNEEKVEDYISGPYSTTIKGDQIETDPQDDYWITVSVGGRDREVRLDDEGGPVESINILEGLPTSALLWHSWRETWEVLGFRGSQTYPYGIQNVTVSPNDVPAEPNAVEEEWFVTSEWGDVSWRAEADSNQGPQHADEFSVAANGTFTYRQSPTEGEYLPDSFGIKIFAFMSTPDGTIEKEAGYAIVFIAGKYGPKQVGLGITTTVLDGIAQEPIRAADGLRPDEGSSEGLAANSDRAVIRFTRHVQHPGTLPTNLFEEQEENETENLWARYFTEEALDKAKQQLTIKFRLAAADDPADASPDVKHGDENADLYEAIIAEGENYVLVDLTAIDDADVERDEKIRVMIVSINGRKFNGDLIDESEEGVADENDQGLEVATVVVVDNDQVQAWGSNNVDAESTGLARASQLVDAQMVDLFDGRHSWQAPFSQDVIPTLYFGYAASSIVTFVKATEGGLSDEVVYSEKTGDMAVIAQNDEHGTLMRPWLGAGEVAANNPNPTAGNGFFGYVDALTIVARKQHEIVDPDGGQIGYSEGRTFNGVLLLRRDGTSAWFEASYAGDTVAAEVSVETNKAANQKIYTSTFNGLTPGRHYYISGDSAAPLSAEGLYQADEDGKIEMPSFTTALYFVGTAAEAPVYTLYKDLVFATPVGTFGSMTAAADGEPGFVLTMERGTRYEFDERGLLLLEADRRGNQTRFGYDFGEPGDQVRLNKIEFPDGGTIEFDYRHQPRSNDVEVVTDRFGRRIRIQDGMIFSDLPSASGVAGTSSQLQAVIGGRLYRPDVKAADFEKVNAARVTSFLDDLVYTDEQQTSTPRQAASGEIGRLAPSGETQETRQPVATYRREYYTNESAPPVWKYQFDRYGLTIAMAAPALESQSGSAAIPGQSVAQSDVWTWERDTSGLVVEAKSPAGRGYVYNSDWVSVPADGFDVVQYVYDDHANLETVRYADGTTEIYVHDPAKFHQLKSFTDRNQATTTYELYDNGDVKAAVDPLGNKTEFAYTAATKGMVGGLPLTIKSPQHDSDVPAQVTRYEYYQSGPAKGLVRYIHTGDGTPQHRVEEFVYDQFLNLKSHRDADGIYHHYVYDRLGRLLEEYVGPESAKLLVAKYGYDSAGNRRSVMTPSPNQVAPNASDPGVTTRIEYDAYNRASAVIEPIVAGEYDHHPVVRYAYTADGLVDTVTTYVVGSLGVTILQIENQYDARRQKIEESGFGSTGELIETRYFYDAAGNIVRSINANDQATSFTYDADGRVVRVERPDPDGDGPLGKYVTRTEYDAAGRTTAEYAPNPNATATNSEPELATRYEYDAAGQLIRVQKPMMRLPSANAAAQNYYHFTAYWYNADGSLKEERSGIIAASWYKPYEKSAADGSRQGDMVQKSSWHTYDALGRPLSVRATATNVSSPVETRTWYEFDSQGRRVVRSASPELTSFLEHHMYSSGDPTPYQTIVTFDLYGRVAQIQSPDPDIAAVGGEPNQVPNGDLHAPLTKFEYYTDGKLYRETRTFVGAEENDPRAIVTTYVYDELGRAKTVSSQGRETQSVYDSQGRVNESLDPEGIYTRTQYNALGQVRSAEVFASASAGSQELLSGTEYQYDDVGNVRVITVAGYLRTELQYDALNRVVRRSKTYLDGSDAAIPDEVVFYDGAGNVKTTRNGLMETTNSYDEMGRTIQSVARDLTTPGAAPRTTTVAYDDAGLAQRTVDPELNVSRLLFDGFGRKQTEELGFDGEGGPAGFGSRHFIYDADGRVVDYTDRNGRTTHYVYDGVGRLVEEHWIEGTNDTRAYRFTYDDYGRLVKSEGIYATTTYSDFDAQNRPRLVTTTLATTYQTLTYALEYDYQDQLGGAGGPDPEGARSGYSVEARSGDFEWFTNSFRYDAAGRLVVAEQTAPGGREREVTYAYSSPASSAVTTIGRRETPGTGQAAVEGVTTTVTARHPQGSVVARIEHYGGEVAHDFVYQFDALERLSGWTGDGRQYDLDRPGNGLVTGQTTPEGSQTVARNGGGDITNGGPVAQHRLASNGVFSYYYDQEGNLTGEYDLQHDQFKQHFYDHRNRLVQVQVWGAMDDFDVQTGVRLGGSVLFEARLRYDAQDRLISKSVTRDENANVDRREYYVYDGQGRAATLTYQGSGIYLARRSLVTNSGEFLAEEIVSGTAAGLPSYANGTVLWLLTDAQGSVAAVAVRNGATFVEADAIRYDALGNSTAVPLTTARYAGRAYDAELGLYDYGGRVYDSRAGRFLNVAPRSASSNPYHNADLVGRTTRPGDAAPPAQPSDLNWFEGGLLAAADWSRSAYAATTQWVGQAWDDTVEWVGKNLDSIQTGLDVAGMTPIVGAVFDVANAGIHALRGNWGEAAMSFIGAIPGLGDAFAAGNKARKALDAAHTLDKGLDALRAAKAAEAAKDSARIAEAAKAADRGAAFQKASHRTDDVYDAASGQLRVIDDGPNFLRNGGCFAPDTPVILPGPGTAGEVLSTRRIDDVPLGARVAGENPRPWEVDREFSEPDADTWVRIVGTVRRSDGAVVEMELLRPRDWAARHGFATGATVSVEFPELEVRAAAAIRSVEPSPAIAAGEGHVVTGRFVSRDVANLIRLTLSDGATLDVTANHPLWSADRAAWIPAGELEPGEALDGVLGQVGVKAIELLGYSPAVYNLEVHGQHVYRVARPGVLVHNNGNLDKCGVVGQLTPIHKNSRAYQGDSHVYVIKAPDGSVYKVGKSSAGTRLSDDASIRAESQVRKMNREDVTAGGAGGYRSRIRKDKLPSSGDALDYEAKWRDTYRRLFGQDKLPGNKER